METCLKSHLDLRYFSRIWRVGGFSSIDEVTELACVENVFPVHPPDGRVLWDSINVCFGSDNMCHCGSPRRTKSSFEKYPPFTDSYSHSAVRANKYHYCTEITTTQIGIFRWLYFQQSILRVSFGDGMVRWEKLDLLLYLIKRLQLFTFDRCFI